MSLLVFPTHPTGAPGDIISLLHFAIVSRRALLRNYNYLPWDSGLSGLNRWYSARGLLQTARRLFVVASRFGLGFVKVEAGVERTHRQLGVLRVDDTGDLDLRGGDQVNADVLAGQDLEHLQGHARVGAHA